MAIFNSYVSLPEGNFRRLSRWKKNARSDHDLIHALGKLEKNWDPDSILMVYDGLILLMLEGQYTRIIRMQLLNYSILSSHMFDLLLCM